MWCINHESVPSEAIESATKYFPGSKYVDVIGLDGFNFGTSRQGSIWQSFSQIFSRAYLFVARTYPTKPVVISEVASSELGGDKRANG